MTEKPRWPGRLEKVCIFLDNTAIYRAVHHLAMGEKLDYRKLKGFLGGGSEISVLRFYCGEIPGDSSRRSAFYNALQQSGFDIVVSKKKKKSDQKNAGLDPEITRAIHMAITWDMCELLQQGRYDRFILVSGSPEYKHLVEKVRARGIDVEVCFFEDVCSWELKDAATHFRSLEIGNYLISKRPGQQMELC